MIRALFLAFLLMASGAALALAPGERLSDPALEARARDVSAELRCLVCQNQSIDDSDAELAKDLRRLVRERIAAGDSNAAVKDYLSQRYGEFVLLKPPFSIRTALLWGLPFAALLAGALGLFSQYRRRQSPATARRGLSDDEQQALTRLIADVSSKEAGSDRR